MPTGRPDPRRAKASRFPPPASQASVADRLIQEAMEAGEFDDLSGIGQPIPGAGTMDDESWWVRSWLKRNQDQESPNSR